MRITTMGLLPFAAACLATTAFAETSTDAKKDDAAISPVRVEDSERKGGGSGDQSRRADNARSIDGKLDRQRRTIEEVIVTAQKRAESLQDVPLSIAVVTAEDVSRRGLVGAEDYLRGIPGVNQEGGGGSYNGQTIVIRGMETQTNAQNYASGPTTATYFGEVPTTNSAGLLGSNVDIKLVDIERVEVLRGPQGTAFGSSSMGGVVRTIPIPPNPDSLEARVAAGYSSTSGTGGDNYNIQGVGNLPLLKDKLAVRAVAYQYQDSGYYRNRAGSDATFVSTFVEPFGLQAFAKDEEEVGSYYVLGGRFTALAQLSDNLKITLSYLNQKAEADGYPIATSGTYEQTVLQLAPENVRRGRTGAVSDSKIEIANAVLEYDIGWADLLLTYSDVRGDGEMPTPWGAGGLFNFAAAASSGRSMSNRQDSGEIRLATKFNGAWDFLAGLYAERVEDSYYFDFFWHGDPTMNFLAPGERFLGDLLDRRDLKQKAAFGEASWEFLPHLTLTGGVRVFSYERSQIVDTGGTIFGGDTLTRNDADASGENFRANLSYKLNENAMLYAGWTEGFRLGKPQARPAEGGLCDLDSNGVVDGTSVTLDAVGEVDSDSVDSYEVGAKVSAFDRRVVIDGAIFRMEWSNIPVADVFPCGWFRLANAGAALSEGVELMANFYPVDALRIDIGGSWVDARLLKDAPIDGFSAGDRLPGAPKVNASLGVQYEFNIARHPAFLRSDAIYVGSFYEQVVPTPNTTVDAYTKLNLSAGIKIDRVNIDLFIRNVTNEDAFTSRSVASYGPYYGYRLRPRTVGLQLSYSLE